MIRTQSLGSLSFFFFHFSATKTKISRATFKPVIRVIHRMHWPRDVRKSAGGQSRNYSSWNKVYVVSARRLINNAQPTAGARDECRIIQYEVGKFLNPPVVGTSSQLFLSVLRRHGRATIATNLSWLKRTRREQSVQRPECCIVS